MNAQTGRAWLLTGAGRPWLPGRSTADPPGAGVEALWRRLDAPARRRLTDLARPVTGTSPAGSL